MMASYTRNDLSSSLHVEQVHGVFECKDFQRAYLIFMKQFMLEQKKSADLVLNDSPVDEIIVEGGFANNPVFIELLKLNYPDILVTTSQLAQGSALGAAMMIKDEVWKN